jgi:hypothetical protein
MAMFTRHCVQAVRSWTSFCIYPGLVVKRKSLMFPMGSVNISI